MTAVQQGLLVGAIVSAICCTITFFASRSGNVFTASEKASLAILILSVVVDLVRFTSDNEDAMMFMSAVADTVKISMLHVYMLLVVNAVGLYDHFLTAAFGSSIVLWGLASLFVCLPPRGQLAFIDIGYLMPPAVWCVLNLNGSHSSLITTNLFLYGGMLADVIPTISLSHASVEKLKEASKGVSGKVLLLILSLVGLVGVGLDRAALAFAVDTYNEEAVLTAFDTAQDEHQGRIVPMACLSGHLELESSLLPSHWLNHGTEWDNTILAAGLFGKLHCEPKHLFHSRLSVTCSVEGCHVLSKTLIENATITLRRNGVSSALSVAQGQWLVNLALTRDTLICVRWKNQCFVRGEQQPLPVSCETCNPKQFKGTVSAVRGTCIQGDVCVRSGVNAHSSRYNFPCDAQLRRPYQTQSSLYYTMRWNPQTYQEEATVTHDVVGPQACSFPHLKYWQYFPCTNCPNGGFCARQTWDFCSRMSEHVSVCQQCSYTAEVSGEPLTVEQSETSAYSWRVVGIGAALSIATEAMLVLFIQLRTCAA